jgi:hypothetical protein
MLFLAPNGSDGGSCSSTSPCLTFDRAYHAAAPGQTVQVGAGTYPVQRMSRDASKIGEVANVVFQSAPGELAVLAGIVGDDISHVTFLGNSSRDLAPPHSGLTLKSQPLAMDTGGDFTVQNCSSYVTVHGVDMITSPLTEGQLAVTTTPAETRSSAVLTRVAGRARVLPRILRTSF